MSSYILYWGGETWLKCLYILLDRIFHAFSPQKKISLKGIPSFRLGLISRNLNWEDRGIALEHWRHKHRAKLDLENTHNHSIHTKYSRDLARSFQFRIWLIRRKLFIWRLFHHSIILWKWFLFNTLIKCLILNNKAFWNKVSFK